MDKSISVRIPVENLKDIDRISKYEKSTKSAILRNVLNMGIKSKMLEIALKKFQDNEVTAWKAARLVGIPLTKFLDILNDRKIEFHYDKEELRKDLERIDKNDS